MAQTDGWRQPKKMNGRDSMNLKIRFLQQELAEVRTVMDRLIDSHNELVEMTGRFAFRLEVLTRILREKRIGGISEKAWDRATEVVQAEHADQKARQENEKQSADRERGPDRPDGAVRDGEGTDDGVPDESKAAG